MNQEGKRVGGRERGKEREEGERKAGGEGRREKALVMVTAQLRRSFLRYFSSIHWTNIDHSAPSEFLLMYSIHCSLFSRLTCSSIYVYPVLPSPHLLPWSRE